MQTVMNTNRITGMYSGIDTDALVKAMTMTQQAKVDQLNAKMQKAEWKKDALNDFNNQLRVFRDTYGSMLSEGNLISRGAYNAFTVSMASNSGVNISAGASARAGTYNVRVDQIATAATMRGAKLTNRTTGLTDSEVGSAAAGRLTMGGVEYTPETIEFTINGKEFSFSANASLRTIMDTVNRSDAGVSMSYSQTTDRITVTSNQLGERGRIDVTDKTGFLSHLGLDSVTGGQDAIVYLNGETEARRIDSNTITLDGVTMTFMRPTGTEGVDYTLTADYQPTIDKFKAFIESFNAIMRDAYTAFNQKVNRDYRPLTEDQKGTMSDKEVDLWESKAKEGLLRRDNTLGILLNNMRGTLSRTFGTDGNLASIGITTSPFRADEPVQLELDEAKLTAALQENPDRVHNLMSGAAKDGSQGGFITQLGKSMDDYVNAIKSRDLQNLNNNINDYTKRIKEQQSKLAVLSERYYLQYAKLETMLGQMQSQQDSMSMMFGWNTNQK
jgi:flagellar hook-associated protein 2